MKNIVQRCRNVCVAFLQISIYMNYIPGYGEVNVRVYIDGWHKQVMQ